MSLSAMLFGSGSKIHKITNILGLGIPSLLNKAFMGKDPKMAAITLGELSQQTAKEGEPRPIAYGICRPIGANVIYQSQPIRRMVKTYVGKAGGKGGSKEKKQYQDVEHVYRYYALRVCEGPITGYRRIWRNGTLVYDARKGSAWGAKNNHLFFNSYRLYTGGWDQMPDPAMQSMLKTTDIPAFRGTAYLMAVNEDLTDFGGAIPQWQFEVVRSEGYYLTSRPYAVESIDRSEPKNLSVKESPTARAIDGSAVSSYSLLGGVLRNPIVTRQLIDGTTPEYGVLDGWHRTPYELPFDDGSGATGYSLFGGWHRTNLIGYEIGAEGTTASNTAIAGGSMNKVVVNTGTYLISSSCTSFAITGGTHEPH